MYDPKTGRWLSVDPIGFTAGDANLYRYVGNKPCAFVDASGLVEIGALAPGLQVFANQEVDGCFTGPSAFLGIYLYPSDEKEARFLAEKKSQNQLFVMVHRRVVWEVERCSDVAETNEWNGEREGWYLMNSLYIPPVRERFLENERRGDHAENKFFDDQPVLLKSIHLKGLYEAERCDDKIVPKHPCATRGKLEVEWEAKVIVVDVDVTGSQKNFNQGKYFGPCNWEDTHSSYWLEEPPAWSSDDYWSVKMSVTVTWDSCDPDASVLDVKGIAPASMVVTGARPGYRPPPGSHVWVPRNGTWEKLEGDRDGNR